MTAQTDRLDRRCFVAAVAAVVAIASAYSGHAQAQENNTTGMAPSSGDPTKWMNSLTDRKTLSAPLPLLRFADPVYVLTKPITWAPSPGQPHGRVEVPAGFVTDLSSIPRLFWAVLPPDGDFAYAAVLHDYLYWEQDRPREESDQIFKLAMEDLNIDPKTIAVIQAALRVSGGSAWDSNARLKASGEKRILKKFPTDPRTIWVEWKKRPDVFGE
jgi:Protein of unknown function (DUF1353)